MKAERNKRQLMAKRKAAMEQAYKELWYQGIDKGLIIDKIADQFFMRPQSVREILKPRTIRKRLNLTTPKI